MARRNFTRPHRLHALNELNVTPLLDLCFCLLIIFMIATPVMEQSKPVNLPESTDKPGGAPPKTKAVVVSFTTESLEIGGKTISIAELRNRFKEYGALDKDAQPVVRVRGDVKAAYGRFGEIVDAMKAAKLTKCDIVFQER